MKIDKSKLQENLNPQSYMEKNFAVKITILNCKWGIGWHSEENYFDNFYHKLYVISIKP